MEEPRAWWRRINWQLLVEIAVFAVAVRVACIYSGQLDQMIKSNGLTEQTMRLDQRAWVAVTAVNSKQPPQIKQRFTYSVHFIDTGKTPASNVVIHAGDELLDKGQQPNFSLDTPVRLGVLSPGSERTFENGPVPTTRAVNTMTEADLAVLKVKTLSIHGKITYDDIFGCHHWITYCSVLKDDWSGYAFCSENNDTDPQEKTCVQ